MTEDSPNPPEHATASAMRDRRARQLADRHGLPERAVRALLEEHDGQASEEGKLGEALTSLAHFLRAPS